MKTKTKISLIIAAFLVLIGCALFSFVMTKLDWNFTALSTVKYETNNYEIDEAFDGISVNVDTADVEFLLSDDGKCRVECYEKEASKHFVTVEDNTLVIKMIDKEAWYNHIGINFTSPQITIYLPTTEYGSLLIDGDTADVEVPDDFTFSDVKISLSTGDVDFCASASGIIEIKTTTGDIDLEDVSASALDLSVSTGKVTASDVSCAGDVTVGVSTGKAYLTDIQCKSVISSGNTGDIALEGVIATERFSIERSTGDVKLDACDAAEIFIETNTGDVSGTLLSDKVFITRTNTGSVKVPDSVNGGRCQITTDTGNIKIAIN